MYLNPKTDLNNQITNQTFKLKFINIKIKQKLYVQKFRLTQVNFLNYLINEKISDFC